MYSNVKTPPIKAAPDFVCPECEETTLERVVLDAVTYRPIYKVYDNGRIDYGEPDTCDDSPAPDMEEFRCADCGCVIATGATQENLYEILVRLAEERGEG